jgi:hypothetical protein
MPQLQRHPSPSKAVAVSGSADTPCVCCTHSQGFPVPSYGGTSLYLFNCQRGQHRLSCNDFWPNPAACALIWCAGQGGVYGAN